MDVNGDIDQSVSGIAAAIGEPARARMLYCLMDQRARTSTELAVAAGISPSTASVHLSRLRAQRLVKMQVQGKHRYYTLGGGEVASVLESLGVLAGGTRAKFVPNTPGELRAARTCYDHIAGTLGVALDDRMRKLGWLTESRGSYELMPKGEHALAALGVDIEGARALRRKFAYACLDWSERRPHVGGALGAAMLKLAIGRRWVTEELDSRVLSVTRIGRRELARYFGVERRKKSEFQKSESEEEFRSQKSE